MLSLITNNLIDFHQVEILTFDNLDGSLFYNFNKDIKISYLKVGKKNNKSNIIYLIQSIFKLRKHILLNKPNVVIGFMHSSFIPLALVKFFINFKLIGSEHASYDYYKKRNIEKFLYKLLISKIDILTTVSNLSKLSFPKNISKKMIIIENPINIKKKDIFNNKKYKTILSIGSLKKYKNHSMLIDVFLKLQKNFPEWNLKIIGDGEEYNNLLNKISNQKNIKIYKSQLDISTFYLESSFLVVASEYESFSLVTAEALFYKLPVVGFQNCIGLNELIEHNSNGILVEHKGRKSINLYNQLFDIIASKSYEVLSRDNTKIISKYEIYNVIKKWNNLFDRI